jgi:hypothetical protein
MLFPRKPAAGNGGDTMKQIAVQESGAENNCRGAIGYPCKII